MNSLVSIIIPTYARPDNLCRAINSVLLQTYQPIEIIVVDDNGEGTSFQIATEKLLKDYIENKQITYIKHNVNKNGAAARNTGVKVAKGVFVGLLDDDDVFDSRKIEEQVNALEAAHQLDSLYQGCFCNVCRVFDEKSIPVFNPKSKNLMRDLLLEKVAFNSSTMLFFRDAFLSIGGFDERFRRHQDWEFSIRFLSKYKMLLAAEAQALVKKFENSSKSGNIQETNPVKFISIKEMFLQEMAPYIDSLPKPNEVYHHQWMILSNNLLNKGFFKLGYKYYRKASFFAPYTMREYRNALYDVARYYKNVFFNNK